MRITIATGLIRRHFLISVSWVLLILGACTRHDSPTPTAGDEIYTCSMHPQVIEHAPGRCPICGMPLVKKENAAREITGADLSALLQPVNTSVLSSVEVATVKTSSQPLELKALGTVEYDSRYIKTISAWVSGRIDNLYIKYRFQPVHAGQRIMDIYSPQILTAEQNLLFLLQSDPSNLLLISDAREKLLLLGMHEKDVQHVMVSGKAQADVAVYSNYSGHVHEAGQASNSPAPVTFPTQTPELSIKEGMYIERGQPVFQVNDMRHVSITLHLFPFDNAVVTKGTPVTIHSETETGTTIKAKIDFIEPFYRDNSRTLTARVYFDNSKLMIPVGSQVEATLAVKTPVSQWLPETSVLSLGLNKVIFVKRGKVFKVQQVSTGIVANHLIQVKSGINPSDSVAANAQFLVDSEGFIKVKNQ